MILILILILVESEITNTSCQQFLGNRSSAAAQRDRATP